MCVLFWRTVPLGGNRYRWYVRTWLGGGAVVLGQVVIPVDRPPAVREHRAFKIRLRTTHDCDRWRLPTVNLSLGRCQ